MNWIGAILLAITGYLVGSEYANKLVARPKTIRLWKNSLLILEAEIVYSQATVKDACEFISSQIDSPVAEFYHNISVRIRDGSVDLYEVWVSEMNNAWKELSLKNEDREILNQFGRTLGQHDLTQQKKYIQLAIVHLENKHQEAIEQNQKYGKMTRGLGLLGGIFVALLLI
ncbi:stage III sporulation protein SpoIIIAB [Gracilibacillus marinus]|jgi:stage III sporulation protein AB|uniref:Stage III sporulation protein SpoIIIAB n=1 Tax=Gracilibacillus marinus TaxID=630535 RepID=A0ABV8VVQ8_9BACI